MMVSTQVLGPSQWGQGLRLLIRQVRQSAKTEVSRATKGTASVAKKEAPKASGVLRGGISTQISNEGLTGEVFSSAPYGEWVEGLHNNYKLGRKPGRWPPDRPIREWVQMKGLATKWFGRGGGAKSFAGKLDRAVFLVRRKIGRKGTPAKPFIKPAVEHWAPMFKSNLERVFSQAVQQIGNLRAVAK